MLKRKLEKENNETSHITFAHTHTRVRAHTRTEVGVEPFKRNEALMTDWDWLFTACYIVIVKPLTVSFYNRRKIPDRDDGQRCSLGEAQQKLRMTEIQPLQSQYRKYFNNSQLLFPVYPTWMAEIPLKAFGKYNVLSRVSVGLVSCYFALRHIEGKIKPQIKG